jgi:hypothetical protein
VDVAAGVVLVRGRRRGALVDRPRRLAASTASRRPTRPPVLRLVSADLVGGAAGPLVAADLTPRRTLVAWRS